MTVGGNSDEDPSLPNPIDRWETLLERMAEDVTHIRQLVTMAWWAGWIVLAVVVALSILID